MTELQIHQTKHLKEKMKHKLKNARINKLEDKKIKKKILRPWKSTKQRQLMNYKYTDETRG